MTNTTPKLSATTAGGLSTLALQSLTAPLLLVGLYQPSDATPRWLTGLYIALELGAIAAGLFVAWGMRSKRPAAHLAPAVLLLPAWLATAAVAPLVYSGLPAVLFAVFSICMGAVTSLPLMTASGRALFVASEHSAPALSLAATIK